MDVTSAKLVFLLLLLSANFQIKTIELGYCQGDRDDVRCLQVEMEALVEFQQGLNDPSGLLSSWVGQDCCKWRGVSCNNRTRHVVRLDLHNLSPDGYSESHGTEEKLSGNINPSLIRLKDLDYLDLSMNSFSGAEIHTSIGALNKLRHLNLSGVSFGGTIPSALRNLSSLQVLDLRNDFNDPSESTDLLWLSGFSSLKYLNMGGVDLSKAAAYWVQIINTLPSLIELHLYRCALTILPHSLPFINFTSLSVLDLSNNRFNSTIPPWLFNISSLEQLNLKSNNLQGEIPDAVVHMQSLRQLDLSENSYITGKRLSRNLGQLCNLQMLDLSFNNIRGEITDFIDSLSQCGNSSSLETLDLEYNELGGNLPVSLGYLKNLRYLELGQNNFHGPIPGTIGNLSYLEGLYLTENQMTIIPESVGQLSSLTVLDLSENLWEGIITEVHLQNLSSLKEMSFDKISANISLVFNISSSWIPPFKLRYINIRSCELGPKFPAWLQNQNELTTFKLNNARIADTIPDWFWQLNLRLDELDVAYNQLTGKVPNSLSFRPSSVVDLSSNKFGGPLPLWPSDMVKLYLRDNKFSGPIPENIGHVMPFLTDLDISWNYLNGSIPLSIGNLMNLTTLVVSNNNLSGEIPDFWSNMPFLYILDVSNNSLSGKIPESVGTLNYLLFLVLSSNNLSGKLPSSLKNCSLMESLDIGENRFSGMLPSWIGESMKSLLILRIRSNLFSGNIPEDLCTLSYLHILDLSHNNLSGKIPACIGNLTGLKKELTEKDTEIYQGRLRIVAKGRVLEYYSTLYLVNSLDLSSNNLSGEIPLELTELVKLGTLNLSVNHLAGNIPLQIGKLDWLETLDLSRNKLSGPIPPSMSQMTFLNHLDLSYNNLSGKIPTTNQFQTLNDPSIYEGNPDLCGQPLPRECSDGDETPEVPDTDNNDEGDDLEKVWFFLSVALGFIVGFWGVCGTLIIKKSWRHTFFRFIDDKKDAFLIFISANVARLHKKFSAVTRSEAM